MRLVGSRSFVLLMVSCAAIPAMAQPAAPAQWFPVDGGWMQRDADLRAGYSPSMPPDVHEWQFEVHTPPGTIIYADSHGPNRVTSNRYVDDHIDNATVLDAGMYWWRVRALNDAGVASAWTPLEPFRIDFWPPPEPGPLTVFQDGGFVRVIGTPVVDQGSGLDYYHVNVSALDALPDAGSGPPVLTSPVPDFSGALGPGTWTVSMHAHDLVDYSSAFVAAPPIVVVAGSTLTAPPRPVPTWGNGAAITTLPYTRDSDPDLRHAGAPDGGVGVAIGMRDDAGAWFPVGSGTMAVVNTNTLADGWWSLRTAYLVGDEVSPWSEPVDVLVDNDAPRLFTPALTRDGGAVTVQWPSVLDFGTVHSGTESYAVVRTLRDAGVSVGTVPETGLQLYQLGDVPPAGRLTYRVDAIDRAGNVRSVTVGHDYPPPAPGAPVPAQAFTTSSVQVDWTGVPEAPTATWDLIRFSDGQGIDGGALVGSALVVFTATEAPGEGRWFYAVRGIFDTLTGEWSAPSAPVIVDQTPPTATQPATLRTGASGLSISWTASDNLSGVAATVLERETVGGGVTTVSPDAASPAADTPPDGTHRYRVQVTDGAGNSYTSFWSAEIVTPAPANEFITVDPIAAQQVVCGQALTVSLSATGAPVDAWSVETGPAELTIDGATLSWTPGTADEGIQAVTVRADGTGTFDTETFDVEVLCRKREYTASCGCGAVDGPAALAFALAALALRRRRSR